MKAQHLIFAYTTLFFIGCGESSTPTSRQTTPLSERTIQADEVSSTEFTSDTSLALEGVSAQVDEGISSIVEDISMSSAANFGLTEDASSSAGNDESATETDKDIVSESKPVATFTRSCTENDATAVVEIKREFELSRELDLPRINIQFSNSYYETIERIWSQEGSDIVCNSSKKHAVLPIDDVAGLNLKLSFERKKELSMSKTIKKTGETSSRVNYFHAEGTRDITWTEVEESESQYIVNKTIISSVSREIEVQNKSGETKKISFSIATDEENPLKVKVARGKSDFLADSRTIKSGSLISSLADGGKVVVEFSNVTYEKKCLPASGTISGTIFAKDDLEHPTMSFSISVVDGEGVIKFYDAEDKLLEEKSYEPSDCDIEVAPEKMEREAIPTIK